MTITETILQLRTESGWYVGDKRAGEVLEALTRDRDATIAQLEGMLRRAKEQIAEAVHIAARDGEYACMHENELRVQLAAMTTARDDAVQAAHIVAEELAQAKAEIERYENEPHK